MALRRLRHPCGIAREPLLHLVPRVANRLGVFEHAWIGDETQKREKAGPWQTDARKTIQLAVEPIGGNIVLGKRADMGVNQNVGVD